MKVNSRWAFLAVPLCLLGLSSANANPLDAGTATKEAVYTSSFEGYVKDQDFEAGGWAAANKRVGEIGGWRTYLRQAQEPMTESKPASGDQKPMPHSGHGSSNSSIKGVK